MATDGEHSDCQWLDLREHLQETMMFSSRFMFVFPVKFSMKKSGMQWCFTFSGKRNILFFSFAGLLAGLTWSIQNRSEWRTTTNQLFYSEQSPKGQTFRLHSASFLKNIVDVVGSPQTLSTHINPTKASLKRGKNNYHETTSKTIQPVKVLQCLGPSTAHEFSGTFHTVQNIAIAIVKGIPIVSWINLVLHSPNFQWHSTVSFG